MKKNKVIKIANEVKTYLRGIYNEQNGIIKASIDELQRHNVAIEEQNRILKEENDSLKNLCERVLWVKVTPNKDESE